MGIFHRKLGRSGIEVSAMGLGCSAIGEWWTQLSEYISFKEVDDEESILALRRAMDLGVNFERAANSTVIYQPHFS